MKRIVFLIFLLMSIFINSSFASNFTVVIDPGHGGNDGGAARGKAVEKNVNLAVALNLGKLIEDSFSDVKVVYTRKTDIKLDLDRRAEIANKAKANLFISIHTNSTEDKITSASGADTYILGLARSEENKRAQQRENSVILLEDNYKQRYQGFDPNSPESYIIFQFMTNRYMQQSLDLASMIQSNFKSVAKRKDRGVRQAGFLVLRETAMPSILIELGFINNPTEAKYLTSAIGQRSLASAIFTGFKEYKREFDKIQSSKEAGNDNVSAQKPSVAKQEEPVSKPAQTSSKPATTPQQTTAQTPQTPVSQSTPSGFVSKPRQEPVVKTTPTPPAKTENKPVETKQPENKETQVVKPQTTPTGTEYRVQFLMSSTQLKDGSSSLKGLSPVNYYIDNGNYKYTYGSTSDRNEAVKIQREVRTKFKDAFIIEFRDGKRVK